MNKPAKHRLLIVDDDKDLIREIAQHLERQGYDISTAETGRAALDIAAANQIDAVILDLNFPEPADKSVRVIDGVEVLRQLRETGEIPILVISATTVSAVKVMLLKLGADDYLAKPFDHTELSARIEALLRRCGSNMPDRPLEFQRLRLDPGARRVWKDGAIVELTRIEFDILYTLARRPQFVFTREKIIELAWQSETYCITKAVDIHIGHIRRKLEDDPADPRFIQTVRGTGYRFEDVAEELQPSSPTARR